MSILLCVCDFQEIGSGSKLNQLISPKHNNMRKIGVGVNAQMVQNGNMEKRQWSEKHGILSGSGLSAVSLATAGE